MSDKPAIIECTVCAEKFDVSGIEPGTAVKCASCKSVLEVPDFEALLREIGTLKLRKSTTDGRVDQAQPKTLRRRKADVEARRESGRRKAADVRRDSGRRRAESARLRRGGETSRRMRPLGEPPAKGGGAGGGAPVIPIVAGMTIIALFAIGGIVASRGGGDGETPRQRPGGASGAVKVDPIQAEFVTRYEAAGDDLDKLMSVADWAGGQGLDDERERLIRRILNDDADHEGANKALGRVRYEKEWMTVAERDRRIAEHKAGRGPIEKVLGKALFEMKTDRFHIFMQRSGYLEPEKEQKEFDRFVYQVGRYFKGWYERKRDELPGYSDGKFSDSDPNTLPRLRIALVTDSERYKLLSGARFPRASKEAGFFDKENGVIWAFHDVLAKHPPFYDSFLFSVYTQPFEKQTRRAETDYIIWRKGLKAFDYLGEDVQIAVSKHFLVAVQQGEGYSAQLEALRYRDYLDAMFGHFETNYAEVVKSRGDMPLVPIYVFANRQGYLKYAQKTGKRLLFFAAGHYDTKQKIMMSFRPKDKSPIVTILHEGTHVLMAYLRGFRKKTVHELFWLQEGIADFCAGYRDTAEGIAVGRINNNRFKLAKAMFRARKRNPRAVMPLSRLVRFSQGHWMQLLRIRDPRRKQAAMAQVYAHSWAFMHFLYHYENGKYRDRLSKFLLRALTRGSTYNDFIAAWGSTPDFKAMDQELQKYMESLSG